MLIFFGGVFLVTCRSELAHFNPSEGEMLVNFSLGVFLVACRSEWGHFKTPEGGKLLSIFWAACRPKFFDF